MRGQVSNEEKERLIPGPPGVQELQSTGSDLPVVVQDLRFVSGMKTFESAGIPGFRFEVIGIPTTALSVLKMGIHVSTDFGKPVPASLVIVHFPAEEGTVSGFIEDPRKGRVIRRGQPTGIAPSVYMRSVFPSRERKSGRNAERGIAVAVFKDDSLFGEAIHCGGMDDRIPIRPGNSGVVFIGHDEQDIGGFSGQSPGCDLWKRQRSRSHRGGLEKISTVER